MSGAGRTCTSAQASSRQQLQPSCTKVKDRGPRHTIPYLSTRPGDTTIMQHTTTPRQNLTNRIIGWVAPSLVLSRLTLGYQDRRRTRAVPLVTTYHINSSAVLAGCCGGLVYSLSRRLSRLHRRAVVPDGLAAGLQLRSNVLRGSQR